jgi:hypothetical protein
MKQFLTLILTLLSLTLFAQSPAKKLEQESKKLIDSAASSVKKDTVNVDWYIVSKKDTLRVETLVYKGEGGVVKWCSPGYMIILQAGKTRDGKEFIKTAAPVVFGALDDKKRLVKPIQ